MTASATQTRKPATGLAHWMERVLTEISHSRRDLATEPVHDLRVALRRCRSIAEALAQVDPDAAWKKMRKASRDLFRALGDLRDCHVLREWISRLDSASDPAGHVVVRQLATHEQKLREDATAALNQFDEHQWSAWAKRLTQRSKRLAGHPAVFECLALRSWEEARTRHRQLLRDRSKVSAHRLRIELKRFRYLIENFLPEHHEQWSDDLKRLQDLLGEIHDLDMLWDTLKDAEVLTNGEEAARWRTTISAARQQRMQQYRETMLGPKSLWPVWRAGLPRGGELQKAVRELIATRAALHTADYAHAVRVEKLSRQLMTSLRQAGVFDDDIAVDCLLQAAALMHDAGRGKRARARPKRSAAIIRKLDRPPGWTPDQIKITALVARYHQGPLPSASHKAFRALPVEQRRVVLHLSAVLRLANVLDEAHTGVLPRLKVEKHGKMLVISIAGFVPGTRRAEKIASGRYLLEYTTRLPVVIRRLSERKRARIGRGRRTSRTAVRIARSLSQKSQKRPRQKT
jgi:CHAD domain-containing protein